MFHQVFNQHHREHHLHLGDSTDDVDVPLPFEVKWIGNTPWKKAIYLFFYGVILSSRSGYKLGVKPNKYLYMNWVSSIGTEEKMLQSGSSHLL
jgi:sphingolipid 4-desaturase/C4-monooxygenase